MHTNNIFLSKAAQRSLVIANHLAPLLSSVFGVDENSIENNTTYPKPWLLLAAEQIGKFLYFF
jgi:hypothetical protein